MVTLKDKTGNLVMVQRGQAITSLSYNAKTKLTKFVYGGSQFELAMHPDEILSSVAELKPSPKLLERMEILGITKDYEMLSHNSAIAVMYAKMTDRRSERDIQIDLEIVQDNPNCGWVHCPRRHIIAEFVCLIVEDRIIRCDVTSYNLYNNGTIKPNGKVVEKAIKEFTDTDSGHIEVVEGWSDIFYLPIVQKWSKNTGLYDPNDTGFIDFAIVDKEYYQSFVTSACKSILVNEKVRAIMNASYLQYEGACKQAGATIKSGKLIKKGLNEIAQAIAGAGEDMAQATEDAAFISKGKRPISW